MKLINNKLGLCILFCLVCFAGFIVGIKITSYYYNTYCFSRILDRDAIALASQINTVCQLRLGQVGTTIDLLEKEIDWNIVGLAQTPNVQEGDYRYNILRAAKTYREIYPSRSQVADVVYNALSNIEKIYMFEYDTPLCRLVECAESQKKL
jgi:hypothetical protein